MLTDGDISLANPAGVDLSNTELTDASFTAATMTSVKFTGAGTPTSY